MNWDDHDQPNPWVDHQAFISNEFVYDTLSRHGWQQEGEDIASYSHMWVYGPYNLAPGEKAKVVIFYGGALGAQDPKYTSNYKRYGDTFGLAWMNLYDGTGFAPVSFRDRQKEIPWGEDALARHLQRAVDIYNWGYDVPDTPPSIKLSWDSNLQGNNEISWSAMGENSSHPDYTGGEAKDLVGYRIYRSKSENHGPWDFITEGTFADMQAGKVAGVQYEAGTAYRTNITGTHPEGLPLLTDKYKSAEGGGTEVPGIYKFGDATSNAGFPYWYSIRYYTTPHAAWSPNNGATTMSVDVKESPGMAGMGSMIGARSGIIPVVPGADIYDGLTEQVRVVPNPWKVDDDLHSYKRTQILRFTNLPGRAKIDLYDVTGQRIWTAYHDNPLRGEWSWYQFSENRPSDFGEAIFSGIYFWKVESMMPGQIGKVQTGTFVIIK